MRAIGGLLLVSHVHGHALQGRTCAPNASAKDFPVSQVYDNFLESGMLAALAEDARALRRHKESVGMTSLWVPLRGKFSTPDEAPPTIFLEQIILQLHRLAFPECAGNTSNVAGAEVWAQVRNSSFGQQPHFDKDQVFFAQPGNEHFMRTPLLGTVTYFDQVGGPSFVVNQSGSSDMRVLHPDRPDAAAFVFPREGRHLIFRGDLWHGVRGDLAPPASAERVTLLVNWWAQDLVQDVSYPVLSEDFATGLGLSRASGPLDSGSCSATSPVPLEVVEFKDHDPVVHRHMKMIPLANPTGTTGQRSWHVALPERLSGGPEQGAFMVKWTEKHSFRGFVSLDRKNPFLQKVWASSTTKCLVVVELDKLAEHMWALRELPQEYSDVRFFSIDPASLSYLGIAGLTRVELRHSGSTAIVMAQEFRGDRLGKGVPVTVASLRTLLNNFRSGAPVEAPPEGDIQPTLSANFPAFKDHRALEWAHGEVSSADDFQRRCMDIGALRSSILTRDEPTRCVLLFVAAGPESKPIWKVLDAALSNAQLKVSSFEWFWMNSGNDSSMRELLTSLAPFLQSAPGDFSEAGIAETLQMGGGGFVVLDPVRKWLKAFPKTLQKWKNPLAPKDIWSLSTFVQSLDTTV